MKGKFGKFGGTFVPELLMPAVKQLDDAFQKARRDPAFKKELAYLLKEYAGRPTPLYLCANISKRLGCKFYLKREDLLHTGAHKINNTLGQGLLAKYMGKKRIIAETGAGQHGVASAVVGAMLGIPVEVYMGEEDIIRQKPNVFRMKLAGAQVIPVKTGSRTLKDAVNEALRDWISNVDSTYYMLGSCVGPAPYPQMVKEFQSVIGKEARRQCLAREKRLPDLVVACVGGGSNSIGTFADFIPDKGVELLGIEAAGKGIKTGHHGASLCAGSPGVLHGSYSYVLQTPDGQIKEAYSISAGLDYPGVGPEHSFLKESGRATYQAITDQEALEAFKLLSQSEGIIPALESAHAVAGAIKEIERRKRAGKLPKDFVAVTCLSGRGDKDLFHVAKALGVEI